MTTPGPLTLDLQTANWLDPLIDVLDMVPGAIPSEISLSVGPETRPNAMEAQALAMLGRFVSAGRIPLQTRGDASGLLASLARLGLHDCLPIEGNS